MAFLRRISDSLWSYVSPENTNEAKLPTPKSEPVFKKPAIPRRRTQIEELAHNTRSMSPNERVEIWQPRSPFSQASSTVGLTRKRRSTGSSSGSRLQKKYRTGRDEYGDGDYPLIDDEYFTFDETDDQTTLYDLQDETVRSRDRRSSRNAISDGLGDDEIAEPSFRHIACLPDEHRIQDISDHALRAKGWDDDYINLLQRLALRGYEPLLPSHLKFDFRWLPTGLFETNDDAFIGSVTGRRSKISKALELLFQLGGHVRDRIECPGRVSPERQMRRQIRAFNEWAQKDAGIDQRTAIPVLATAFQSEDKDPSHLINGATIKCRQLAARYCEALRVERSVEFSPEGSDRTQLSYPLPTFYAIIGSGPKLAIMAYDPKKAPEEVCAPIALFNLEDPGYDVWNSLALAITVCHARNVQMMIAEETGIGLKHPDLSDQEIVVNDPDA